MCRLQMIQHTATTILRQISTNERETSRELGIEWNISCFNYVVHCIFLGYWISFYTNVTKLVIFMLDVYRLCLLSFLLSNLVWFSLYEYFYLVSWMCCGALGLFNNTTLFCVWILLRLLQQYHFYFYDEGLQILWECDQAWYNSKSFRIFSLITDIDIYVFGVYIQRLCIRQNRKLTL